MRCSNTSSGSSAGRAELPRHGRLPALLGALDAAGQLLRVRLTSTRVSVFDGQQIVADTPVGTGGRGQYSTAAEHVPPQHREISGVVVTALVHRPGSLVRPGHGGRDRAGPGPPSDRGPGLPGRPEHPGNPRERNKAKLEAACQQLLNVGAHPTYSTLKRLMAGIDSDTKTGPVRAAASNRKT